MSRDAMQLAELRALLQGSEAPTARLKKAMDYLHDHRSGYHWVGIYTLQGSELHLGPYHGPTTDHLRIPVGRGVCGTAVAENRNQIVADVRELTNYLACNLETRSEIVVLVREPGTEKSSGRSTSTARR